MCRCEGVIGWVSEKATCLLTISGSMYKEATVVVGVKFLVSSGSQLTQWLSSSGGRHLKLPQDKT